jgi:hypothetical protein
VVFVIVEELSPSLATAQFWHAATRATFGDQSQLFIVARAHACQKKKLGDLKLGNFPNSSFFF